MVGRGAEPPGIRTAEAVADLAFASTRDSMAEEIVQADAVFAWRANRDLLMHAWARATRLRWIQSSSAGVDGLLFPELVESDVVLTNARGIFDDAIAEYVVGLMLMFAKGLVGTLEHQRRKEWHNRDTESLGGRRLLVAGVGPIGRAIARAARAMGMRVRGFARTARPGDGAFESIHGADEVLDAVGWADYVVNALPSVPGTKHLFDAEVFTAMRPAARFVNVGRGATVDELALIEALREGRIAGAALDVFEEEPLPEESPLWEMRNVIVSPHVSGDFAGWREAVVELFLENLGRFVADAPLRNVVDKRLGYVPTVAEP
jgi:phosphoglycerate dehydrogenase-like enzyme